MLRTIALMIPDPGGGGIYQYTQQLILALCPHVQVHVIVADPFGTPFQAMFGAVKVHVISKAALSDARRRLARGPLGLLPQISQSLAAAFAGWHKVEELGPDVVEVCDWPLGFVPAVLSQSRPYVVQMHGSMGQLAQHDGHHDGTLQGAMSQLLELQLLGYAHRLQTSSETNAAFWSTALRRDVAVVRPPLELADWEDEDRTPPRSGIVLGRLQCWKGPHVLAAALRRMGGDAPIVDWYGGVKPWAGAKTGTDEHLASTFPGVWGSKLRHHGPVSRMAAVELQRKARFTVVPSTWDVFNFSAAEAMANGSPAIASTGAGVSELIVDGENGFTFVNEQPDSLAHALERLLSLSDTARTALRRAAYDTIRNSLSPERIASERVQRYVSIQRSFVKSPPAIPPEWLTEVIMPVDGTWPKHDELIKMVPLRAVLTHALKRVCTKVAMS